MTILRRVREETRLARREVRQGRFQRSLSLVAAMSAIVSGFEAYIQHQRGDFTDPWMWTPVWLTPPTVAAVGASLVSERAARTLLPAVSIVSLADGVIGFYSHIRGIRRMPGGFSLGQYNMVMGPPIFAPLLVGTVGVTGLIASMLRRETAHPLPRSVARLSHAVGLAATDRGVRAVETDVAHGRFQQGMALTSAAFAILAGGEAYFEHMRGSYNQRLMWTPVWVTPPMVAAAVASAFSKQTAQRVLPVASAVTFLDGMLGFGLHLRGIYRMPGRFSNLRFNLTMGPPLFAPLLFTAVGLLGFTASLLKRSQPR
ncbi:MAG: hypothetical protein M3256_00155 [Actinomycetota bacterium]|nr:hypothetical protein [Actinomycetota bacterium]